MRFFLAIAAGAVEKATKKQATPGRFVGGNRLQEATSAHAALRAVVVRFYMPKV